MLECGGLEGPCDDDPFGHGTAGFGASSEPAAPHRPKRPIPRWVLAPPAPTFKETPAAKICEPYLVDDAPLVAADNVSAFKRFADTGSDLPTRWGGRMSVASGLPRSPSVDPGAGATSPRSSD